MRKITTLLFLMIGLCSNLQAQLPAGTIAADFNVRDINGNQHHLYSYLNQGKTVILDFSAAWCPLCFSYHSSKALADFYTLYGPDGSDEAMVLFIEKDQDMGIEDLRGNTNASAGDFITGTPYPIIDTSILNNDYQPNALPTIYGIHPDRRLTTLRNPSTDELLEFVQAFEPQDSMMMDTMIEANVRNFRDVSCAGAADGLIDIEVAGPAEEFSYLWSNGDTTQDLSNLPGGVYSCVIIDNLGNQLDLAPVSIFEPDSLQVGFLTNTPSSMTATDGSLIANINGGIQPYSFVWGDGSTGNMLSNIGVGSYTVQVTDANGCESSGSIDLEVPVCALFLAINVEPTTCDQNADGEVNILVERAQGQVTFEWNTGDSTQNLRNLPSGGYEVTVTDALGCSAIAGGMVTASDNIRPIARVRSEFFTVYLNQNGEAFLSGTQVDSGSFDNCSILGRQLSQEAFDCSDIGRNFVEFAVIDEALNMTRREIEVTVLDTISPYFVCPDTSLSFQPCNGVVDYEAPIIMDNCPQGATTTISGPLSGSILQPGQHDVTYNHISSSGERTSCTLNLDVAPWITGDLVVNDAKCAGENSGSATVVLQNNSTEYSYQWSDGQTTGAAVNLAAGDYAVTVEDTTECSFAFNFFVGEPVEIFARVDSIFSPDGRADVFTSVFGGTPPYNYEWVLDGQVQSTVRNPQNLQFGLYTLRIIDSEDCVKETVGIRVDASTAIHDRQLAKAMILSPNPSQGTFELYLPNHVVGTTGTLRISNLMGQSLWSQEQILQAQQRLVVGGIPAGTYFLQVLGRNGQATRQIVIH